MNWAATVLAAAFVGSPSVIDAVHVGHGVGREQYGVDAVRDALAGGRHVNEKDQTGWTPIMHAALECRPAIVEFLIAHGADVNVRASNARATSFLDHGQTALIVASSCFITHRRAGLAPARGMPQSYMEYELAAPRRIVRRLLAAGADPNTVDADGQTPLMMAAMHGWRDVVKDLLSAGANVNARDQTGRPPIDYAAPTDTDVLGLLRKAGSKPPTGRSGRVVCDAEGALDWLGYDTPIIDCIAADQLRAKLIHFQKDRGLVQTGDLDSATRAALSIR